MLLDHVFKDFSTWYFLWMHLWHLLFIWPLWTHCSALRESWIWKCFLSWLHFSLFLLAGWLCTVQSSCPECYCSVLLTRDTKKKPSEESSFVSPQELQHEKNDRKRGLNERIWTITRVIKIFFNEIGYKKRSHVIMVFWDLIRRVDSYSKNYLCTRVASSLRACILMVHQSN